MSFFNHTFSHVPSLKCWKFYSHNSYTCNGDCISMANAQGTIMQFNYQGNTFGYGAPKETFNSGYTSATTSKATTTTASAPFANFKANAYIGLSTVLFIGTFLAFAIARASARAFDKKMKSQYLLFDEDDAGKKKSSSRSTARSKSTETRRSERQKKSTKSPSASKSQRSTRSKSKARDIDSHRDLDTPVKSSRSASRSKKERISSSRVVQEDEPPRRSSSRRKERDRDADYRRYYDDDFWPCDTWCLLLTMKQKICKKVSRNSFFFELKPLSSLFQMCLSGTYKLFAYKSKFYC